MSVVARVDSVWRYPVKSMRGQELPEIFAGFSGVWGDRLFAFKSSATPVGFPYLTGREAHQMLLYRPRFRHPEKVAKPANLEAAQEISAILNFAAADPADLALDVETPTGEVLPIEDPVLLQQLTDQAGASHSLTLLCSERAMTDCRPISLFSLQTARQLGEKTSHRGMGINESDWQRFMGHLEATLDKFSVPAADRAAVLEFVDSTKADIIE